MIIIISILLEVVEVLEDALSRSLPVGATVGARDGVLLC